MHLDWGESMMHCAQSCATLYIRVLARTFAASLLNTRKRSSSTVRPNGFPEDLWAKPPSKYNREDCKRANAWFATMDL